MPSYNASEHIEEAIESILSQSFTDYEFIIINDGSTDDTEKKILKYEDSRIRYIKNNKNIKLIASLNKGFTLARGKYITRMDADDISLPNRLSTQVNFMESNPEIGISGGQMVIFGDNEGVSDYPISHEECVIGLLDQTCFSNNLFIIRKSLVEQFNFKFNPNYLHAEDYKFYTSLISKIKGANLTQTLTKYRRHDNSVSKMYFSTAFENRKKIRQEYSIQLLALEERLAQNFYGSISLKKAIALKQVREKIKLKFPNVDKRYIDDLCFNRIWYKDALYESEYSHLIGWKYLSILTVKSDLNIWKNFFNVWKHYIKQNLLK